MNTRFAPALALSLVAALAADAAVSSTSTSSSTEKAPAPTGQFTLGSSADTGYTGATSFVRSTWTLGPASSSGLQAGPPQAAPAAMGNLQLITLKFDQKLEPITAIQATGIQRATPAPAPKPEPQSSTR